MPFCREDRCSNKSPTRTGTGSSNEQVEKLLANASTETFTMVARGALDDASVTLVGKPKFAEITTGHNDKRTIGIVKVIGSAMVGVGEAAMIIYNEKKSANRTPKESNPQDRLVILPICGLGFSPSSLATCRHWLRSR